MQESQAGHKRTTWRDKSKQSSKIIITHPDRLTRFGFETLKTLFQAFRTEIIVINKTQKEPREELIEDLITITSHFNGRCPHKYKEVVENAKQLFKK
ncbi:Putative resolvase (C-terminus fragment) [Pyrococcus abyssi GE5]|uniref:Resolvase (C-terminus) n=1 Tax=Pyrococcus abyssi (strain GE5 / Orsay) TaxID=272844 RepID=Q8J2X8_PYRAB|nr:Putative resolvase (C-terminus fragment) [Pyrococcus abyssi GE5]